LLVDLCNSEALTVTTLRSRFRPQGLRVTPPRILAATLLCVLVTVVGLWRSDVPNVLRAVALIAHVALGLLVVPFALFTLYEIYKQRRRAFPIGHALVLATGTVVLIVGGSRRFALALAIHAAVGAAFFMWALFPRRVAFLGAPLAFVIVFAGVHERAVDVPGTSEPIDASLTHDVHEGPIALDKSALVDDAAERFVDDARCTTCHKHILVGTHVGHPRVASARFSDALQAQRERSGQASVTECAACHDVAGLAIDLPFMDASTTGARALSPLPCLTCHGASPARITPSGPVLSLALPDDPLVTTDGVWLSFARALTHVDARAHRARMRTMTTRASMSCTTCHRASAHARLATHATASGAPTTTGAWTHWPLERAGPSSPLRVNAPVCVDCHTTDAGKLPARLGIALLKTDDLVVTSTHSEDKALLTFARDVLALDLVITNENAGHGFPASPFARELTVIVDVTTADGARLRDADDLTLHPRPLGARLRDRRTLVFDEPLSPGRGLSVHLHLPLPRGSPPVHVAVRLLSSDEGGAPREIASTSTASVLSTPVLLARYADVLARIDHRVDAALVLAKAEEIAPADLDVKLSRATFLRAGAEGSAGTLTLLLNERGDHVEFVRALASLAQGHVDNALPILEMISPAAPFDVELAITFASTLVEKKQVERARRVLAVALAGNPGHRRLLAALADLKP
jgi:hypothetical protein